MIRFEEDEPRWSDGTPVPSESEPGNVRVLRPGEEGDRLRADAIEQMFPAIDWQEAWTRQPDDVDWLVEPIIERGRAYALYAPAKAGKSLLTLELVAALATGRSVLSSKARKPMRVVYIDAENAEADLVERLSAYGYGPGELAELKYLSFPPFNALDTPRGGQQLLAVAQHYGAEVVCLDTTTRFVEGKENDSDTFHALYRHALAPLKGLGMTVIRLDHSGKDEERGQRGSSAKASDVDVVWRLTKQSETSLELRRDMARNAHSPELLRLRRSFSPLRHVLVEKSGLPAEVEHLIDEMQSLGIPVSHGRDKVREALTTAGISARNDVISAAIKARKGRVDALLNRPTSWDSPSGQVEPGSDLEDLSPRSGQFSDNRRSDLSRTDSGQVGQSLRPDLSPPPSLRRRGQVGQDHERTERDDRIALLMERMSALLAKLAGEPAPVGDLAAAIGMDDFDADAALKQMELTGEAVRHRNPNGPDHWSINLEETA